MKAIADHSGYGHFVVAVALLCPVAHFIQMYMVGYSIMLKQMRKQALAIDYNTLYACLMIPMLICIILGIIALVFGIREKNKRLAGEGVFAMVMGVLLLFYLPVSLGWEIMPYWLFKKVWWWH